MSLQFILGGAGTGKTYYGLQKMIALSKAHRDERFYIIVPEQFTMQTQKELVQMHPDHGILNIDVLSFERLAYRVFEEVGGGGNPALSEVGKTFVLQRVIQKLRSQLRVLGSNAKKTGTVAEIKSMISELMQYLVEPEDLDAWIEKLSGKALLCYKLRDIQLIYAEFLSFVRERYTLSEDVLHVLADRLEGSKHLSGATLLLDGFTGFTPIQNEVLSRLLPMCKQVFVTASIDEKTDPFREEPPHRLFSMTTKMIHKLLTMCEETHVTIGERITLSHHERSRFHGAPALRFLESRLFRYKRENYDQDTDAIRIFAAADPAGELMRVAASIHRMVRREGYRYRDFAVLTGDLETYATYVSRTFPRFDIPCFVDRKLSMLLNPFVELIRSALDLVISDFSYETLFRFLRCGLTGFSTGDIDVFENYVLALGIRGLKHYGEVFVRTSRTVDVAALSAINRIREALVMLCAGFADSVGGAKKSVRQRTEALYAFITRLDIQRQLKEREVAYRQAGELARSKEYGQVYGKVMNLFDKLVEILGDESLSLANYRELLEAGLTEEKVALIPPSSDEVVIGDIERTRIKDVKVLFFVGTNDGVIPKDGASGGILSEPEREALTRQGVELAPTQREEMYMQRFYLYLSLTKARRRLILSYAKSGASGENRLPSYLIGTIRGLFPAIPVMDCQEQTWRAEDIETKRQGIDVLIQALTDLREASPAEVAVQADPADPSVPQPCMPDTAEAGKISGGFAVPQEDRLRRAQLELFGAYRADPDTCDMAGRLAEAAFYTNTDVAIGKAAALALYGSELSNSATRLELFASCAFAHFMQYGLNLREREIYEFTPADIGTVLHQALERFSKELADKGLTLRGIPEEEGEEIAEACVDQMTADYGNTIFHSSKRNEHMILRIKRLIRRTVWALKQQIEAGAFEPGAFEISFLLEEKLSDDADSASYNTDKVSDVAGETAYKTSDVTGKTADKASYDADETANRADARLKLTGRIDRMDLCEQADKIYVKIIDYKSGSTSLDVLELYYGLQLQLVVYLNAGLDVVRRSFPDKTVEPAGIFYYHIKDPYIKIDGDVSEEYAAQKLLATLKPDGLLRSEPEVVHLMDADVGAGQKSDVLPIGYNKNGSLSKASSAADKESFDTIMSYTKRKIRDIGRDILSGDTAARPYRLEKQTGCTYCPYHGICGFDERIDGYRYKNIRKEPSGEVIRKMGEDV